MDRTTFDSAFKWHGSCPIDKFESRRGRRANYSVIQKFIEANVGRYYDDVYSEVCKMAPKNSERGQRFREAFKECFDFEDHWRFWNYRIIDGIIVARDQKIKFKRTKPEYPKINGNVVIDKIDGILYEFTFEKVKPRVVTFLTATYTFWPYDYYAKTTSGGANVDWRNPVQALYNNGLRCTKKRQLNSKELRDLAA